MTALPLRPSDTVMTLERLGAFHQTRLSFVRSLVRKIMREGWQIERIRFDLDAQGYGLCLYQIRPATSEIYTLVIFSHHLDDQERTDRVIAEKWDIACALCEGILDEAKLAELKANIPKQEAGRNQPHVLVLSRANKSTRQFAYFVDCLAKGEQPDPATIAKVGYLLRTTAVYGNGKFGVADYSKVQANQAFSTTFRAQMFTVYMIRQFSLDLVEHIARQQAPDRAVPLKDELKRYLGVGNATGLGMAPFLINHPRLIHTWILARETAIARVLYQAPITRAHLRKLHTLVKRATKHFQETYTEDTQQQKKYNTIVKEMTLFQINSSNWTEMPESEISPTWWQEMVSVTDRQTSLETQELIYSLLLELYPDLVNDLENEMEADETYDLQPAMSLLELRRLVEQNYAWALQIDFTEPKAQHYFWYRSMEKEEPRFGVRDQDRGADKEVNIDIARMVSQLYARLNALSPQELEQEVTRFLLSHPQYKGIIRRIQSLQHDVYAEIHSNLLDQSCLPLHLLRCKLSFFGASRFDPKSSLWTRITLFQGAPLVSDIGQKFEDDWSFPCMPRALTKSRLTKKGHNLV